MEMMELGDLEPSDMISLDRQQWVSVARSGHFHPNQGRKTSNQDEEWERERGMARERWLRDEEGANQAPGRLSDPEARRAAALSQDHAITTQLVEARAKSGPSLILGGIALLTVLILGIFIWRGEGDDTIQTSFQKVSNCALPPAEGVSWVGCVRAGEVLRGAVLRNADLSGGDYDGADLSSADLAYANLRQASLRNTDLRNGILMGADLTGADLRGANLSGADLRYALMAGSQLEGARLEQAQLGKATWIDGKPCAESSIGQCR
jgi:uncharacterized protein YjbI with pentapeptide repeats